MQGKLIIFSAPSGAGKTTIVRHLLEKDLNLEFSISATSRGMRHTETEGKDYYYMTPEEFRSKIENDEFLEWEEVYAGTFYGTLKSEVERIRTIGQNVIFANVPLLDSIPQEIRKSQGNIRDFEVFFYFKITKIYNCQTASNVNEPDGQRSTVRPQASFSLFARAFLSDEVPPPLS